MTSKLLAQVELLDTKIERPSYTVYMGSGEEVHLLIKISNSNTVTIQLNKDNTPIINETFDCESKSEAYSNILHTIPNEYKI